MGAYIATLDNAAGMASVRAKEDGDMRRSPSSCPSQQLVQLQLGLSWTHILRTKLLHPPAFQRYECANPICGLQGEGGTRLMYATSSS